MGLRRHDSPVRSHRFQAVAVALTQVLGQSFLAAALIAVARVANPSSFGRAVTMLAVATALVGLMDFGVTNQAIREISSRSVERRSVDARIVGKLGATTLVCIVVFVASVSIDSLHEYWPTALISVAMICSQAAQIPLRGLAVAEKAAVAVLLDRTILLLVTLFLVGATGDPVRHIWIGFIAGPAAAALLALCLTAPRDRIAVTWPSTNPWKGSLNFGIFSLSVSAQSLDLPIAAVFGGHSASGLYGSVNRWTAPLTMFSNAFAATSVPFIVRTSGFRQAFKAVRPSLPLLVVGQLGAAMMICFAGPIVAVLLGAQYASAAPVLRLLAGAAMLAIISQPLAIYLQTRGHERSLAVVTLPLVVCQLVAVAIGATLAGAEGAAAANLLSHSSFLLAYSLLLFNSRRQGLAINQSTNV